MEKVDSEIDDVSLRLALACLQLPHMVDVSPAGVPISTANDATDGGDELEDTTECTQSDAAYNKEEKGDTNQSVGLLQPPACLPTITMLVCADIDLQSASELAEYTLRQQQHRNNSGSMNYRTPFDAHAIDLIVVAGPCTRGEGDLHYYSSDGGGGGGGSNGGRRSHSLSGSGNDRTGNFNHDNDNNIRNTISSTRSNSHRQWKAARRRERLSASTALTAQTDKQSKSFSASQDEQDTTELDDDDDNYDDDGLSPFFRTKEESIGLQGILTAAISQLESIVCRVVYCPGWQDPLTILQQHQPHPPHNGPPPFAAPRSLAKRLTPNSRNIHQQWLPLAPGLGCAGLFYLDGIDKLVGNDAATTTTPPTTTDNSGVYADKAPKDDDSEEQNDEFMLMDQIKKLQQCPTSYDAALSKLCHLAPTPEYPPGLFADNPSQTILVTNYTDCQSLLRPHQQETVFDDTDNNNTTTNGSIGSKLTSPCAWPLADHDQFLSSDTAQEYLCLEIASGSAAFLAPKWIPSVGCCASSTKNTNNPDVTEETAKGRSSSSTLPSSGPSVLLPGSLRERGEFSIVQVSLMQQQPSHEAVDVSLMPSSSRRFAWQVRNVDFHCMYND